MLIGFYNFPSQEFQLFLMILFHIFHISYKNTISVRLHHLDIFQFNHHENDQNDLNSKIEAILS